MQVSPNAGSRKSLPPAVRKRRRSADGLLYIPDLSGFLYVLDVETGEHLWTHDTFAAVWGSAFVADGKVYLGDEDGDIVVLEAGREEKVISEVNMGSAVYTTPVAEDGRIYVATRSDVFAIGSK
nr:PQQ-binding-like beta-propeller repeat protein [uncultured Brevundimonas sp.]